MLNPEPSTKSLFHRCHLLVFLLAGGDVARGHLCKMLQRVFRKSGTGKEFFEVGADAMGKSEESSFTTVVGNKGIHLVVRVKGKWKWGNEDASLGSVAGNKQ